MSFGTFAHRVQDETLPVGLRVRALGSCVQMYRPIGFQATLSFLEELAGPFRRDTHALRRAVDALAASRTDWLADVEKYAARRKAAKSLGRRTPGRDELNPSDGPRYWYGAPRQAALHAVRFWRRRRLPALLAGVDPVAADLGACVTAALASGGALPFAQRQLLAASIDTLRQRVRPDLWRADPAGYARARDLLTVARFVETVADPP